MFSIHKFFLLILRLYFCLFCTSGHLFLTQCSHKYVDNGSLSRVFGISEMLHNNQDFLDIHDFLGKRQQGIVHEAAAAATHAIKTLKWG